MRGHHWLTNAQFADIFSISQAAPGPSILIVTLVGYAAGLSVGGVPGAHRGRGHRHDRHGRARRHPDVPRHAVLAEGAEVQAGGAVEKGFAPLTVGLILATSLVMSRAADHDWRAYLLTGIATLIFVQTNTNPLIVVGAAALLGYLGFV